MTDAEETYSHLGLSIEWRLKEYMEKRGMKITVRKLMIWGIGRNSARHILHGTAKSISFDHLAKVCIAIRCTPKEVLRVKANTQLLAPGHPMLEWAGTTLPQPEAILRTLNVDDLAEADAFLRNLALRRFRQPLPAEQSASQQMPATPPAAADDAINQPPQQHDT